MSTRTATKKANHPNRPSASHVEQSFAGLGLGGIFDGLQKLVEAASRLEDAGGQAEHTGEFQIPGLGDKGKGIFGFSVRTMAGGEGGGRKVKVQPFGNIHKTHDGVTVEEAREPVVDVFEEGDVIRVVAELPGVRDADVKFSLAGDILTISTACDRRYHAEVLLPAPVEADGIESAYNNGVLELKLKRAKGAGK
jgi:HSP20 family protein